MMQPKQIDPSPAASGPAGFGPLLVPPDAAFQALGIGRTKGWELIRDGRLLARKIGSRTVVEAESVRRFAAALPRAGRSAP
jgi:hypothetical protein